jgi:hypothetical protein
LSGRFVPHWLQNMLHPPNGHSKGGRYGGCHQVAMLVRMP